MVSNPPLVGGDGSSNSLLEFRRHRETTNKVHIIGFLSQWKVYLDALPAGPDGGKAFRGQALDPTTLEKVRCFFAFAFEFDLKANSGRRCPLSSWVNYTNLCTLRKMFGDL